MTDWQPGEHPLGSLAEAVAVQGILTTGSTATVELGRQVRLDRVIALKRSRRRGIDDAILVREARITARLPHRAIVPVYGLYTGPDGEPVLAMKLLSGSTWSERITQLERPLTPATVRSQVEIAIEVATALEFAHARGVLHLDVKPANVVEGHSGDVHVIDWGCALDLDSDAPRRERFLGTPSYAAPEVTLGQPLDARTDVYLVGGCLYAVLYGRPPHQRETPTASMAAATQAVPFPPCVDTALAAIAQKALAVDPADRWQSMADLRRALQEHLSHDSSLTLTRAGLEVLEGWQDAEPSETLRRIDEALATAEAALDLWPENPLAYDLTRAAFEARFDTHLALGDLGRAARALVALGDDPERAERLGRAEAEREAEHAAVDALSDRRRLENPDTGAWNRWLVLGASWVPAVFVVVLSFYLQPSQAPSPAGSQLVFILVASTLWMLAAWRIRARIPQTLANDALIRAMTAGFVGLIANRLGCWLGDVPPVPVVLVDTLIIGSVFASFDAARRGMTLIGAVCWLIALTMAWVPELARALFVGVAVGFPFSIAPSLVFQRRA